MFTDDWCLSIFFFFRQKTAYEMRISSWSSDVCSSDLKGLLGAHYFADHPVVPLSDITVALNVDTIAISPRGTPVATIGRGKPAYDAVVREVATRLGRTLDEDGEADAFIQRQEDRKSTRLNSSH